MQIELWTIGKLSDKYIQEGCDIYLKRLKHYCKFSITVIKAKKIMNGQTTKDFKAKEAQLLLQKILPSDFVIALDEKSKGLSSPEFASYLEQKLMDRNSRIIFIIGGALGLDQSIHERANFSMSFSKMTFTHQMIRLFFVEQLYRAFTIIKNEAYHK